MPVYPQDEEIQGLDAKTTPVAADFVVLGDSADPVRTAKKVTFANFVTSVATYITTVVGGFVNSVTGLNTDNTDPKNPIVRISVDGTTIAGLGTPGSPLSSLVTGGIGGGGGSKLAIDTTDVDITGTTAETTIYQIPIPANTLGTNDAIRFKIIGTSTPAGGTTTIKLKYGGTTIATSSGGFVSGSDRPFELYGLIVANGATNAQKAYFVVCTDDRTNNEIIEYGVSAENSTTLLNLTVTFQTNDVAAAMHAKAIVVEKISSGANTVSTYYTGPLVVSPGLGGTTFNINTTMYAGLINLPQAMTIRSISVMVESHSVNGTVSFVIYSEDGQTLFLDQVTATITGNGIVTTVITPLTLPAGNYYFGVHSNGAASFDIRAVTTDNVATIGTPTGKAVVGGTVTIVASTTPATINPVTDITFNQNGVILARFDA